MRKKTIKFGLDAIFWYLLYLMPFIFVIFYILSPYLQEGISASFDIPANLAVSDNPFTLPLWYVTNYMDKILGIERYASPIYNALSSVFGRTAVFPIFDTTNSFMLWYLTYFVSINLLHLFVDFILFIPRLCHKWMAVFTRTED